MNNAYNVLYYLLKCILFYMDPFVFGAINQLKINKCLMEYFSSP